MTPPGPGQRVAHPAPNEVAQLLFDAVCRLGVHWHGHGLGADVIADPRFDRMRGVQLEDRLHLIRREGGQVSQPFAGQFNDGFDVSLTGDAFIDGACAWQM